MRLLMRKTRSEHFLISVMQIIYRSHKLERHGHTKYTKADCRSSIDIPPHFLHILEVFAPSYC